MTTTEKKKPGRKTLLNDQMIKNAVKAIGMGVTDRAAQDLLGITHDTWYTWIEKGEAQPNSIYAEFTDAIKKARAQLQADCIRRVKLAGSREWQAAAWILERKWSEDFGKKDKVDMSIAAVQIIDDIPTGDDATEATK